MTIREELREKYQLAVNENVMEEARKLIEETIIPEFRKISQEEPLKSYLAIHFAVSDGIVEFKTSITESRMLKKKPFATEIIKKAVEIASSYDITAKDYNGAYVFSLDLK